MTSFMIIIVITLFIVLLGFTWYRLAAFEDLEKIIICVIGIFISWGITRLLFSISTNGVNYTNELIYSELSRILVMVFTPINGIILMPYVGKLMSMFRYEEIDKGEIQKKGIIFFVIVLVIFIIEVKYLQNVQLGIFDIAKIK